MTHTVQTSVMHSRRSMTCDFYQVEVENYEGESFDFEVEADSFNEASNKVAAICSAQFIDVYNMNIYKI